LVGCGRAGVDYKIGAVVTLLLVLTCSPSLGKCWVKKHQGEKRKAKVGGHFQRKVNMGKDE
jgi:hypothetical protein